MGYPASSLSSYEIRKSERHKEEKSRRMWSQAISLGTWFLFCSGGRANSKKAQMKAAILCMFVECLQRRHIYCIFFLDYAHWRLTIQLALTPQGWVRHAWMYNIPWHYECKQFSTCTCILTATTCGENSTRSTDMVYRDIFSLREFIVGNCTKTVPDKGCKIP